MKPLAIDLYSGLGGWAEGFLAEGFDVIGFDVERRPYPAQLVLQDVATLDGAQFASAAAIVASPPCQAYSYRAMPWKRARALPPPDNTLFDACFRIQREASEAAGRHIPMVVENVCGAQKWVGRAAWHYGSYYLWGDVPALMPFTMKGVKVAGLDWKPPDHPKHRIGVAFNTTAEARMKRDADSFGWSQNSPVRCNNSHSEARKQASALIAKIPFDLAAHIARCFYPRTVENANGTEKRQVQRVEGAGEIDHRRRRDLSFRR